MMETTINQKSEAINTVDDIKEVANDAPLIVSANEENGIIEIHPKNKLPTICNKILHTKKLNPKKSSTKTKLFVVKKDPTDDEKFVCPRRMKDVHATILQHPEYKTKLDNTTRWVYESACVGGLSHCKRQNDKWCREIWQHLYNNVELKK